MASNTISTAIAACTGIAAFIAVLAFPSAAAIPHRSWITAWHAPAFDVEDTRLWKFEHDYAGASVNQFIRVGAAGSRLRLVIGNETGASALPLLSVGIRRRADGDTAPFTPVTVSGEGAFRAVTGAAVISDPVELPVKPFDELEVMLRFPPGAPIHPAGHIQSVRIQLPGGEDAKQWTYAPSPLESVLVAEDKPGPVVVAIGDSITEGLKSTERAYKSWPDRLAGRLSAAGTNWSVVNSGISGNRVVNLHSGPGLVGRFDRDALDICGVSAVVVLEGINDIFRGTTPASASEDRITSADIIDAYRQMILRAHARGFKIYGGTIIPFLGPDRAYPEGETVRQEINSWIRTSGQFDAVIDFDAAMRDGKEPDRLVAAYDSGDHVHPGDKGYERMSQTVPLKLFPRTVPTGTCNFGE